MANTFLEPVVIADEILRHFDNATPLLKNCNRQYDSKFARTGAKIGSQLTVRKPPQFTVRSGWAFSGQDINDQSLVISIADVVGVDLYFTDADLTLTLDKISKLYLANAGKRLASELEYKAHEKLSQAVWNIVGTPGTAPNAVTIPLQAGAKMLQELTPDDDTWNLVINADANVGLVNALKGLLNPKMSIGKQYLQGKMGKGLGFDWFRSENIYSHTNGTQDGNYVVDGPAQTGATITVDTGTGTFKKGDIVDFAGCYHVHPETKRVTSNLQRFVITADYAGGAGDIAISPSIVVTGAYQNVSASPADNAAITMRSGVAGATYPQNIAFHRDALHLTTADIEMPSNVWGARSVQDNISMRVTKAWDINSSSTKFRVDILYGLSVLLPGLASRVTG